jgi:hypothetical protein
MAKAEAENCTSTLLRETGIAVKEVEAFKKEYSFLDREISHYLGLLPDDQDIPGEETVVMLLPDVRTLGLNLQFRKENQAYLALEKIMFACRQADFDFSTALKLKNTLDLSEADIFDKIKSGKFLDFQNWTKQFRKTTPSYSLIKQALIDYDPEKYENSRQALKNNLENDRSTNIDSRLLKEALGIQIDLPEIFKSVFEKRHSESVNNHPSILIDIPAEHNLRTEQFSLRFYRFIAFEELKNASSKAKAQGYPLNSLSARDFNQEDKLKRAKIFSNAASKLEPRLHQERKFLNKLAVDSLAAIFNDQEIPAYCLPAENPQAYLQARMNFGLPVSKSFRALG